MHSFISNFGNICFSYSGFKEAQVMQKDNVRIYIPFINRHKIKMELVLLAEYLYGPFPTNEDQVAIAGE